MDEKKLAWYRVQGSGPMTIHSMKMTTEEILERRSFIRQRLRGTEWGSLCNAELDNVRLVKDDNGYILEDTGGKAFYITSGMVSGKDAEFRKARAMMPFEFLNLTGSDFQWKIYGTDVEQPREYVGNFIMKFEKFREKGMGLYIHSAVKGSGKTMLACCIINELAKRYAVTVKFITALDLLEETKAGYRGQDTDGLQSLYNASVLVLDDIGVQMSREWVDTVFYRLINTRYNSRLVTIYTSNVAAGRLKMDDRITDRIESTTYAVELPEIPVRNQMRSRQKQEIMENIKNAPV